MKHGMTAMWGGRAQCFALPATSVAEALSAALYQPNSPFPAPPDLLLIGSSGGGGVAAAVTTGSTR